MRKIAIATVVSIALAGCQTIAPGAGLSLAVLISDVQSLASSACQFVPTAATIAAIVSKSNAVSSASQMAAAICAAVAPQASGPGSSKTPGYVNGVKIRGKFTH